ncbi:MAG: MFS transporter [Actinobacteria bacterium]|nr:MFS transporter [Actinomycetota bacterium]MBO0787407.1 MFS transporter [Actinomycetota bacterium]MBO0813688.1 MFS transporter [Actinomycetota bacterium]
MRAAARVNSWLARWRPGLRLEPWFSPFALVNGAGVGLSPILLPATAARYGVGHVGLVMGAFNLGALAAPLAGSLADRFRAYRMLAVAAAAVTALALVLFPWAGPAVQVLLGLAEGGGFAAALTVANLLIVERRPEAEWNSRLGWLETTLSVGQAGALFLAAWLSGLSIRSALLAGAIVPAAAIPLALALIPRVRTAAPRPARGGHQLASNGQVGEWGPASPSRVHHLHQRRRPLAAVRALLGSGFGWMLAAWIPSYAGAAVVFSLYPVLFRHAFGVATTTSALAFAVIVLVSLPLYVMAGRVSQRHGPARVIAAALALRVVLLGALAAFAAASHIVAFLPLAAFAGIMFAWSFLSVASPGLTALLKPGAEGDAQGILNASTGLAGLLGSAGGGLIAGSWGYPSALAAGAAAVALGLVILAATMLRRGAKTATP